MTGLPVVTRCMLVRRAVAAADMTAGQTQPQVNPARARLQAFLATGCTRGNRLGIVDVIAGHGGHLSVVSDAEELAHPVGHGDERTCTWLAPATAATRPLRARHGKQRPNGAAVVVLQAVFFAGASQCGCEFGRTGTDHDAPQFS